MEVNVLSEWESKLSQLFMLLLKDVLVFNSNYVVALILHAFSCQTLTLNKVSRNTFVSKGLQFKLMMHGSGYDVETSWYQNC